MRGLLVSFEGRSPNLGDTIRVKGGKILGRVDTVLGPVDSGLVHVYPISRGVEVERAMGSPVEIAPRKTGRRKTNERARGRGTDQRSERGRPKSYSRRDQGSGRRKRDSPNRNTGSRRGRNPRFDNRGSRKQSRGRGRR